MGMYTELRYAAELITDVPGEVIETLQYMTKDKEAINFPQIDHPLFESARWQFMLVCDSYYFDADTHSIIRYDEITKTWFLTIQCNLKNYNDEIAKFVSWITPYIQYNRDYPEAIVGYTRYEEQDIPTLINARGQFLDVTEMKVREPNDV